MSQVSARGAEQPPRFPRVSGDEPTEAAAAEDTKPFSPRERG